MRNRALVVVTAICAMTAAATGQTAGGLFVRTHTFGKTPRPDGKGAADMGPPVFYE